ncbi:MAG: hypothetical protein ACK452_03205 [Bacteroidota bacterium]|jgi:hypothetical protein
MKKFLYVLICLVGSLQIIGYIFNVKAVRGLGAALASSPLPIVFTQVKGVETFASDFFISFETENDRLKELQITPEIYSKFSGPYNRRNVYGAAISYGPILPDKLRDAVLQYAFCKKILIKEFNLPADAKNFSVRIKTKTRGKNNEWRYKINCED